MLMVRQSLVPTATTLGPQQIPLRGSRVKKGAPQRAHAAIYEYGGNPPGGKF